MKTTSFSLLFCFIALSCLASGPAQLDDLFDKTDAFLKEHVHSDQVSYARVAKNPSALNALIGDIAQYDVATLNKQQLKAFYINAYNLIVINGIVEDYPVNSPMDIPGFFDQKKHVVGGKKTSLNDLEKNNLIKATGDARLHFVLVCGAQGCPPIANTAYRPESLDRQIDARTRKALNDPSFIRVNDAKNAVGLSQIFEWYAGDFKQAGGTALEFINTYRSAKIPSTYKRHFYSYDWALNEVDKSGSMLSPENQLGDFSPHDWSLQTMDVKDTKLKKARKSTPTNASTEEGSNVQKFTPSVLLSKNQFELNNLNNLYVQNSIRNQNGEEVALAESQAFLTHLLQVSYGISENARINLGLDIAINSAYYGTASESPTDLLSIRNRTFSRTAVSAIGPRLKFTPFSRLANFSIQSTFTFPIARNLEGPRFTAHDRYTWNTQFFYDFALNPTLRLFLEADFLYRIKRTEGQTNFFRTPLTTVLSYFPEKNTTVYLLYQHSPAIGRASNGFDSAFGLLRWFSQYGIGGKYQLASRLGLEASVNDFFISRADGAGTVYNAGFRFIL